jgi:hypothetical protein
MYIRARKEHTFSKLLSKDKRFRTKSKSKFKSITGYPVVFMMALTELYNK